jgi:hypothetical protein
VFDMPVMAREQLIAAARSLSGGFVLSDLRHLLKGVAVPCSQQQHICVAVIAGLQVDLHE